VNSKGMAQVSDKALKALGDARPGWALVAELGKALGYATSWKKIGDLRANMPADLRADRPAPAPAIETPAAPAAPVATASAAG
jgi:hypothetical protein